MSVKILQAKNDFLVKLNSALTAEKTFSTIIRPTHKEKKIETRELVLQRLAWDLKNPTPARKHNEPIHLKFGDYMDKFVTRVKDAHTHQENVEKLTKLIETTRLELTQRTTTHSEYHPKKKSIHIKFKDGAIRPTHKVSVNLDLYHWELNSDAQPWTSIGSHSEIKPMVSTGEVRLHFKGDKYVSNKINIASVIKRQAAAAKRKQYRFELEDVEFQQRCAGVARRIQRLLSPPVRNITNASFDMRVFQDRVAKLPTHLNVNLSEIVKLCENNDITDPDYIAMVEYIEPTAHLNPKKLHSELKDIYEGKRILLKIDERETRPAQSPVPRNLFMLDSGSTKEDKGETKRQIDTLRLEREEIDRKAQEEDDRIERERLQQIADAEAAAEKLRVEQDEIDRKAQEEDDRIERERLQQVADAEAAAEKLRLEQEEIARKAQEEDDRIERERLQQVADAEAAAEKLRLEQDEIARKAQEEDDRIERERLQQIADAETKKREAVEQLSESDKNYIKYVFDWYDKEPKDGRIELSELKDALSSAGYDAASAEEMLNEYDKDGNGNLDYEEFETWCAVTNAVQSWENSNAEFIQTEWRVEDLVNIKNYSRIRLNGIPGILKKFKKKFYFKGKGKDDKYTFITAPRQQRFEVEVDVSSSEEPKEDEPKEDELSTMTISALKKRATALNKKKKGTMKGYSEFRKGDEKELADLIRHAESTMSIVPPGELSEMLNNMTDDWASSDEELNFAVDSENEDMEFAASSAVDTDDSDLDFAESSDKKTYSGLEFAESSHTSSGIEFAASSAVDSEKSENFAASSAIDTDSDLDFAESSGKTSSGLDFAESSSVESD